MRLCLGIGIIVSTLIMLSITIPAASAGIDRYRNVSPQNYQNGEPVRGHSFAYESDLSKAQDGTVLMVTYSDGSSNIRGILDTSGRRNQWALEPRYGIVRYRNGTSLVLLENRDTERWCFHIIGTQDCVATEHGDPEHSNVALWSPVGDLRNPDPNVSPSWALDTLVGTDNRDGTATIQLLSHQGDVIATIDNALVEVRGGRWTISAIKLGDSAVIRVRNDDGVIEDLVFSFDGEAIQSTSIPSLSSIRIADTRYLPPNNWREPFDYFHLLFTVDVEEMLFWPVYPTPNGFNLAPTGLLGVQPFYTGANQITGVCPENGVGEYCETHSPAGTARLGTEINGGIPDPIAWLAKWMSEIGPVWTIISKGPDIPSYESVLRSADNTHYISIKSMFSEGFSEDRTLTHLESVGNYAFERSDGLLDIMQYRSDDVGVGALVQDVTIQANALSNYVQAEAAQYQRILAENRAWLENYRIQRAALMEQRRQQRIEYEERMARSRAEAEARREAQRAAREARRQARLEYLANLPPPPPPNPWGQTWTGLQVQGAYGGQPRFQIDYYQTSRSSGSGYLVSTSGARRFCELGDLACVWGN